MWQMMTPAACQDDFSIVDCLLGSANLHYDVRHCWALRLCDTNSSFEVSITAKNRG